jgi:DNA-binding transcriptional ArsR family regulator
MAIRIHLTADDLAEIRFAFSPTWELVMSVYKTLRDPAKHALHLPWVTETRRHIADRDLRLFLELASTEGYVADFLTPPPDTPFPDLDQELERVVSTPVEQVRKEIFGLCEVSTEAMESLRHLADDPAAWLPTLGEQMHEYWKLAIEPHWPRIRALLEGDVMYRARQLALGGAELLFADLHPAISFADGVVSIDKHHEGDVRPDGQGLLMIPAVFDWPGIAVLFGHAYQPTLSYSPRGIANLWDPTPTRAGGGTMDELIGGTRADILRVLEVPMTTSEIAQRLHLTPAAVSQQLGLLRRAGVIQATRQGRGVYSTLTAQGQQLLELLG